MIKLTLDLDAIKIKRVIFVACGTSWHAGLIGREYIERYVGIPSQCEYASEFRYGSRVLDKSDLVVFISQSGETADTLAALREAKKKNAKVIGIVNVVGSTIARESTSGMYLHAGPEIGVASTKAFACQVTSLLLLALWFQQERNGSSDQSILNELLSLPELVEETLTSAKCIEKIASSFKKYNNALFLGRGLQYPVALEGALKLKEVSYIHAEGYPAAEMKHGAIALIDKSMPSVVLALRDTTYGKICSNIQEIHARKGQLIIVTDDIEGDAVEHAKDVIVVPRAGECIMPVLASIPLQLLAYYVAAQKGLDVDKPRNLAKSVTVE
ncbi:MAG: glutamine--fructose-6-phosphate transaminase (isomerizing) [Candidatus Woesearchaeota archaeon]